VSFALGGDDHERETRREHLGCVSPVTCQRRESFGNLRRVASGATLREIYDQYSRSVFRRAHTILGDADAAKDATQEVFLRAMKIGGPSQLEPSPLAWLYRVTTNLCLNNLRDSKRRGEILATWRPAPGHDDDDAEARLVVKKILAGVPEELQEIAIYYHVDEMSHEEIAAIVGVSRRTVGNRLVAFQALTGELLRKGRTAS
jgi:RNA polymerase sigma-70 factor (ECF subfamily)